MVDLLLNLTKLLQIIGPLIALFFAVFLAYKLIKGARNMKNWLSVIAESPVSFFFGLVVIALVIFIYFDTIRPALDNILNN